MSIPLLARVRWANVLRLAAVAALIPLLLVALRGAGDAPNVPSGAVHVSPIASDPAVAPPAPVPPRRPVQHRPKPRHRHHRHRASHQPLPTVAPALPVRAAPAPSPAPSAAAEFRP